MHPILRLGEWAVESYALFFVLGWLTGGVVFVIEVRRRGWPIEKLLFAMVGCIFGGILGALVAGSLFFDWPEVVSRLSARDFIGKSVVGGIAGGFLGVEVAKKLVGYPHSTGDAFALAIPLGHAVGRIGCFLGGCCYGCPSELPWAVSYPAGTPVHQTQIARAQIPAELLTSLPVHPTPLYEIGFDLLLFGLLFVLRDRLQTRGNLFRVYLLGYATFRFGLEFFRADSPWPAIGGPKPIQVLLVIAVARYAWLLWRQELAPLLYARAR